MSGQTDIIYKKPISEKASKVYNILESLPTGSHKSREEIYEICKAYCHDDVNFALAQLVEAELVIYSEDTKTYLLNPSKRIKG